MIYQHGQQDPVFEFQAPFAGENLEPQLQNIGISEDKNSLPLNEIYSNITVAKGAAFFTKHFGKTNETDIATRGKILERLFLYTLLRPKTLDEEFGTPKMEEVLNNIKDKNWNLTAFDSVFGPKSTEFMFKHLIVVRHGVYPRNFPDITPDHHLYPKNPEEFNGKPVIMLQKNIHTGHKPIDSFDIMYFASNETHIFSSIFKYQTNPTPFHLLS